MAADTPGDRRHAHQLIEQFGPDQIDAAARVLEVMVDPVSRSLAAAPSDDEPVTEHDRRRFHEDQAWFANNGKGLPVNSYDEPLSDEDHRAVSSSREYFSQNPGQSVSFEELAAACGFTMDQLPDHKG